MYIILTIAINFSTVYQSHLPQYSLYIHYTAQHMAHTLLYYNKPSLTTFSLLVLQGCVMISSCLWDQKKVFLPLYFKLLFLNDDLVYHL